QFCDQCPEFIDSLLSDEEEEQTVFKEICSKFIKGEKNPMLKVCVAGLMGEMVYVREMLDGQSDQEICSWFGCVYATPSP
ncbi:hypothetical protein PMAYCL1PPCAC_32704, partial [Pristionchus mayeri]